MNVLDQLVNFEGGGRTSMTPKLTEAAQRVEWVLKKVWNGSQTRMAADIGVSQSAISHVLTGRQQPGRKFLAAVSSNSVINSTWLITGEGDPLVTQITEPGRRALYIARRLFEGHPEDNGDCLGTMLEVPIRFYRPSRYWYEVAPGSPLTSYDGLRIRIGDYVLFESDRRAWPPSLVDHPCIVRTSEDGLQFDHILNQYGDQIETRRRHSKEPIKDEHGRYYRSIQEDDHEASDSHTLKISDIMAVGIFRMGSFGDAGMRPT